MNYQNPMKNIGKFLLTLFIILCIACSPVYRDTVQAEEMQTITEEEVPKAAKPVSKAEGVVVLLVVMISSGVIAGYAMNSKKIVNK